jgi:hypothetical protein
VSRGKSSPLGVGAKIAAELFASTRKPTRDSLLAHCLGRAYLAANGWERSEEQARVGKLKVNQWRAARAAPKATRVALFISSWAAAMKAEGRNEFTITEYARFWRESERNAYRLQVEFRDLWPEFSTPNELARQVVKNGGPSLEESDGKVEPFPISVEVAA